MFLYSSFFTELTIYDAMAASAKTVVLSKGFEKYRDPKFLYDLLCENLMEAVQVNEVSSNSIQNLNSDCIQTRFNIYNNCCVLHASLF